jgi:cytidine deaminase
MNNDELAVAARDAAEGSYSPYSHFRVGAVVVSADGEIFTGANVENASYPVSSCAESTAINTAVSRGVQKIVSIAVACIDADNVEGAYPCGRCRQEMAEFGVEKVIVTAGDGSVVREHTLEELLPHQFNL